METNNIIDDIKAVNPDILNRRIEKWDKTEFLKLLPFVKEHYWHGNASINVFRVTGTQHPDYSGMTWIEFLENGKRMKLNLKLYAENPQYYYETGTKMPTMYFQSIDGGGLYIGGDGNHRTCIAKAAFYLGGHSILHGVNLDNYTIDWDIKRYFDETTVLIRDKRLPYHIEPVATAISRDDSAGWMLERYDIKIKVNDLKKKQELLLDTTGMKDFVGELNNKSRSFVDRFRAFF